MQKILAIQKIEFTLKKHLETEACPADTVDRGNSVLLPFLLLFNQI